MPLLRAVFVLVVSFGLAFSAQLSDYPACAPRTLQTYGLLGPVKSVRVEESDAEGRRDLTAKYVFDRAGRLLEEKEATIVGDSPEHAGYQVFRSIYEPHGRNYEIDMFEIDPAQGEKPIDLQRHIVKFDSRGRCIEERTIGSDGEFYGKNAYEYDSRGDFVKEIDYGSDGKISSRQERTYSPDHKLLSEKGLDDRGEGLNYDWSREYRYDPQGNRTDMFSYQQGALEAHWRFTYDERNRLISSETIVADPKKDQQVYGKCFDCGLSSGVTTYKYNDAGQVLEERMFQPGNKLVSVEASFYDAHGNRLSSPKSTYLYDSHGNWIQEISPNRESASVRYRIIDYY